MNVPEEALNLDPLELEGAYIALIVPLQIGKPTTTLVPVDPFVCEFYIGDAKPKQVQKILQTEKRASIYKNVMDVVGDFS